MDYDKLFSKNLPIQVDMPAGLRADAKYVFSVTYTDPHTLDSEAMWEGLRDVMQREGQDLAPYPDPQGHPGLREFIADNLKDERGIDTSADSIFLGTLFSSRSFATQGP